jgi:hypothetical protein
MSLRNFLRMGSSFSCFATSGDTNTNFHFGKLHLEHNYANDKVIFKVGGNDVMTLEGRTSEASKLHGTWSSEGTVTTSDRRLKVDILPLYQKLIEQYPGTELTARSAGNVGRRGSSTGEADVHEKVLTVIRQLRPVAFKYKKNAESKFSHYGFIAQEIETVMPNMVDTIGSDSPEFAKSAQKGIRTQDLLAVITLGLQSLDHRLLKIDQYMNFVQDKVDHNYITLSTRLKTIEQIIKKAIKGRKVIRETQKSLSGPEILALPTSSIHSDSVGTAEISSSSSGNNETLLASSVPVPPVPALERENVFPPVHRNETEVLSMNPEGQGVPQEERAADELGQIYV